LDLFQLFKNVKIILRSGALQKQMESHIWLGGKSWPTPIFSKYSGQGIEIQLPVRSTQLILTLLFLLLLVPVHPLV
jgi:hypothetical protein